MSIKKSKYAVKFVAGTFHEISIGALSSRQGNPVQDSDIYFFQHSFAVNNIDIISI